MNKVVFRISSVVLIVIGILSLNLAFQSQAVQPVSWSYEIDYLGNNQVKVTAIAAIEDGWHVYDVGKMEGLYAPNATSLFTEDTLNLKAVGPTTSTSEIHESFDKALEMNARYFEGEAVISRVFELLKPVSDINVLLEYQACDDEKCIFPLPEEINLKIKSGYFKKVIPGETRSLETEAPAQTLPTEVPGEAEGEVEMLDPVSWQFTAEKGDGNEVWILAKPILQEGWHLYADLGQEIPIPTKFWLRDSAQGNAYISVGKNELKPKLDQDDKFFDEIFGLDVAYIPHGSVIHQKIRLNKDILKVKGQLEYQVCDSIQCLPPELIEFTVELEDGWYDESIAAAEPLEEKKDGGDKGDSQSNWTIFFFGFIGGLLAIFTPCVFPMIPMTVSFFTKQNDKGGGVGKALIFGLSIIIIYVGLGTIITLSLGANGMNLFATNPYVNLFLCAIFLLFGLSFLGAFEITLPGWIVNKSDKQADKGGLVGIFFMAFTLGLVSFSCTGPIVGGSLALIVEGNAGYAGPILVMFGFSTALALPFVLFALFPAWMSKLPKSGGWLNSVKVVFGLMELALALKFLSNADLVMHWNILPREIFISFWVVVSAVTGFYLLGKIRFSHDSPVETISPYRAVLALIFFGFSMYMLPGLWGAPLNILSGVLPPRYYVEDQAWMSGGRGGGITRQENADKEQLSDGLKDAYADHCPNDLPCIKDYDEGLKIAKELNKPILLDFTGYACANCRKMEDKVWSDPEIDRIIRNDYILVSLYVDDRKKLPKAEQIEVDQFGKTKKLRTIGNKWSHFQLTNYKTVSQPYYVLLSPDEEKLVEEPVGYTPDSDEYKDYLQEGLDNFKKNSP